jgi:hypothetical protein
MEVAAVLLAGAMAWVEPSDLNPKALVFYPDLVKALVARYGFQKFPQKLEEFDEAKGVTFAAGRFGNTVIEQLVLYTYGIVLDTRMNTDESKRVLEEGLEWGRKDLGLTFKTSMIRRWRYASNLLLHSDVDLTNIHGACRGLSNGITESVRGVMQEELPYEITSIVVNYDQLTRKHPLGRFSIQRRDNTPFSDNKVFSDAPLPTDVHIKLLDKFEKDISSS